MRLGKRIERYGKQRLLGVLKGLFRIERAAFSDFDRDSVSKILVVRQDSRLGNLVLMTPLLAGLREAFPGARIDVLVAEGFHDVYRNCPFVDSLLVFEKRKARLFPWWYPAFVRRLRGIGYDLAVEVSNGHVFSFNNVLLTALAGARYSVGYDRKDAGSFLNLLVPVPPEDMHMADAMFGLVKFLSPGVHCLPARYFLGETDREFADIWMAEQGYGPDE
ncbi:MAG: glycosyltransferase family 9 protein, partial [Candidatus Latescibacteria bacterium]|nr:glycosyltransferase family 9 protein [Candidatus Latescibacterota bacterium]